MRKLMSIMIMLSLSACSQDPIEKCVAAQMEQFDADSAAPKQAEPSANDIYSPSIVEDPETRTEFKARAHLICLSVSR